MEPRTEVPGARRIVESPPFARRDERKLRHHLVYLHAQPLIYHGPEGQLYDVEPLNFAGEREKLFQTLKEAGKALNLRAEAATAENLRKLVTLGCRALHYTGHGLPNSLVFEDGKGGCHMIGAEDLKRLFGAGRRKGGVKFVFVAACHSEAAGNAFVEAGVEHVIAVRLEAKVADQSPAIFMNQFYLALLVGHTVKEAFDIGQNAVDGSPDTHAKADSSKFLLLPKHVNHDVTIFDDLENGEIQDLSLTESPTNLPATPEGFLGRNYEMQRIIDDLTSRQGRRLVNLVGEPGIGKTATAITASRYLHQRHIFQDGIVFVDLVAARGNAEAGIPSSEILSSALAVALRQAGVNLPESDSKRTKSPEPVSTFEIFDQIRSKDLLVVMDGADTLPSSVPPLTTGGILGVLSPMFSRLAVAGGAVSPTPPPWGVSVSRFLSKLLATCHRTRVLVTARKPLRRVENSVERILRIPPLSREYTLRLLMSLLSMPSPQAVGDTKTSEASTSRRRLSAQDIRGHKLLLLIQNHPARIWDAARAVSRAHGSLDVAARAMQAKRERGGGVYGPIRAQSMGSGSTLRRRSNFDLFFDALVCGPTKAAAKDALSEYLPVDLAHNTPDTTPYTTEGKDWQTSPEAHFSNEAAGSHRIVIWGFAGGNASLNGEYECIGINDRQLFLKLNPPRFRDLPRLREGEDNELVDGIQRRMSVYRQVLTDGSGYADGMMWPHGEGWCIGPKLVAGTNMCVAVLPAHPGPPWLSGTALEGRSWYVSIKGNGHKESKEIFVVPDIDMSVTGCTGSNACLNGIYRLSRKHATQSFATRKRKLFNRPAYIKIGGADDRFAEEPKEIKEGKFAIWCSNDGWCIGREEDLGTKKCYVCSSKPTFLPNLDEADWNVVVVEKINPTPDLKTTTSSPPARIPPIPNPRSRLPERSPSAPPPSHPTGTRAPASSPDQAGSKVAVQSEDPKDSNPKKPNNPTKPNTPTKPNNLIPRSVTGRSRRSAIKGFWKEDSNVKVVARCGVLVLGAKLGGGEEFAVAGNASMVNGRYALCEEVLLLPHFARRRFRNRPVFQKIDKAGNRTNVYLWCCDDGWVLGPHRNLGSKIGAAASPLDNLCPWHTSQAWEKWVSNSSGTVTSPSGKWIRDPSMVLLPLSGCVGLASFNQQGAPVPSPKVVFTQRRRSTPKEKHSASPPGYLSGYETEDEVQDPEVKMPVQIEPIAEEDSPETPTRRQRREASRDTDALDARSSPD
ncbi:hypothetical protein AAMO2058_000017700 [Amorphochlora amoebiformis]